MKKLIYLVLAMLLLCGCAKEENTSVRIGILEGEGYTVRNNGQWVIPGEDAVFFLHMEPGLTVADTDHPGGHSLRISDGMLELTLKDVRYPARVRLELTDNFTTITYDPNGGDGTETTLVYDLTHHARPNTAVHLFTRDGYTLESWNTAPDGSGNRVGVGSRADGGTLYAQWEKWNDPADFTYTIGHDITITGYRGSSDTIVIPAVIEGKNVTAIGHRAFENCDADRLILPGTMKNVAKGAFVNCGFTSVTIFDTVEHISDDSFRGCDGLHTIFINAAEAPFGHGWRKESCYADKIDLLMAAAGQKKLVCYGGCAMWYNLDGAKMAEAFDEYAVINLGLNGLANSAVHLQILGAFLEEGDILFHTPELSSQTQMMRDTGMDGDDDKLWCGLENNYDLVSLVEFGSVPGLLDSFCDYLQKKDDACGYADIYTDSQGRTYLDAWGCIPFARTQTMEMLSDRVYLDPACADSFSGLKEYYDGIPARVFIGYACVNLDAVPEDQRGNAAAVEQAFRDAVSAMEGVTLAGELEDYVFCNEDFYDTNYHLRSAAAARNTDLWIRDLTAQLDGEGNP